MSNNLNLDQVAANQDQKEVTINDQAAQLDAAITEILDVDFTGANSAGEITLTATQFRRSFEFRVSSITGAKTIILPASVKRSIFSVVNEDSADTVTVKKGSASFAVSAGNRGIFSTDGTTNNLVKLAENSASGTPVDVALFVGGKPDNAELVMYIPFNRTVVFPAGLATSHAKANVASTSTKVFDIQKNGASVGSITFTASVTGVFAMAAQQTFNAGDTLGVVAPASQDATLADIGINIAGTR